MPYEPPQDGSQHRSVRGGDDWPHGGSLPRVTGAGGGGCIWAIGEIEDIDKLKGIWERVLSAKNEACLLDVKIDSKGLFCEEKD